jgi:hypothetical protein
MKTINTPETSDGVLTTKNVGAGLDAESHLVRITLDNPFSGHRELDRLIAPDAAYLLGMQLVRAANVPNKVVIELDADKVLRDLMEEERKRVFAVLNKK